ncbi:hypothetical protein GYMLUDRAFT_62987 [Collybiopsis luxurians FD-317 M1]|uniref:Uncharacterized protein n=1 Tax=Collybiopsis luxurians FD-317 M1 TaxID=944289 RepID=A0A0D0BJ46_9AGAR|nr:hypothetical protein GYMLUDRAFT_62987 [Collybiopsis luxurians FD-317 M1]
MSLLTKTLLLLGFIAPQLIAKVGAFPVDSQHIPDRQPQNSTQHYVRGTGAEKDKFDLLGYRYAEPTYASKEYMQEGTLTAQMNLRGTHLGDGSYLGRKVEDWEKDYTGYDIDFLPNNEGSAEGNADFINAHPNSILFAENWRPKGSKSRGKVLMMIPNKFLLKSSYFEKMANLMKVEYKTYSTKNTLGIKVYCANHGCFANMPAAKWHTMNVNGFPAHEAEFTQDTTSGEPREGQNPKGCPKKTDWPQWVHDVLASARAAH